MSESIFEIYLKDVNFLGNFQTSPASIKTQRKVPERDSSSLCSVDMIGCAKFITDKSDFKTEPALFEEQLLLVANQDKGWGLSELCV